ncbi:MAG: hypothetical protein M5U26_21820 [Planctomycetota bacterium]|nr:hypothetical protein [Planctomycetota bacterium]
MALPPIDVQLSKFEQLEILRNEIEERTEELKETEKQIRATMYEKARMDYLKALHPLFQQLQEPPQVAQLPQYQAYREALNEAIVKMREAMRMLETETRGQQAPPSANRPQPSAAPAANKRARFDDFDAFKQNRQRGT